MISIKLDKIVSEINEIKYYSFIVDSTPDITTHDQLTIAVRYITKEDEPVEHFLGFMSSVGHKGSDMESAILKKFSELNINLKYCRGLMTTHQICREFITGYRLKSHSSTACFVPCSAHSFNLIGSNAADITHEETIFFLIAKQFTNFFSVSTYRWNILCNIINYNLDCVQIKKICTTRWSSRYDVCKALFNGYE